MPKITQFVLRLESKPGVLAKVARTLADAGVNINALSAPETAGRGKIRMVVSDPERAREVLRGAKYRPTEEAALSVTLENRPGVLAAVAESSRPPRSTSSRSTRPPRVGARRPSW